MSDVRAQEPSGVLESLSGDSAFHAGWIGFSEDDVKQSPQAQVVLAGALVEKLALIALVLATRPAAFVPQSRDYGAPREVAFHLASCCAGDDLRSAWYKSFGGRGRK